MADVTRGFPVDDVDNHMYEPEAAFTRRLPVVWEGLVEYVRVNRQPLLGGELVWS